MNIRLARCIASTKFFQMIDFFLQNLLEKIRRIADHVGLLRLVSELDFNGVFIQFLLIVSVIIDKEFHNPVNDLVPVKIDQC